MKVLNLRCENGHGFEGWFASHDDFLTQNGARQIECPLCANSVIVKMPSAPRLNLGPRDATAPEARALAQADAAASPHAPPADHPAGAADTSTPTSEWMAQAQAHWLQAVRHVLAHTEDVGSKFAQEARRMHYGEAEVRGIRGQATRDERMALEDEGIEVASLPMPAALKGRIQ